MFWLKDKRGKEKKTSWILCKKKIVQRILCFFLWFWPDIWKLYAFLYFMPSDHSNLLLFIPDTGVTCSYTSILMFDAYCTTYWEPSHTSKIRFLTKTARGFQSLTIFTKSSILDILQDTEHSSELSKKTKTDHPYVPSLSYFHWNKGSDQKTPSLCFLTYGKMVLTTLEAQ